MPLCQNPLCPADLSPTAKFCSKCGASREVRQVVTAIDRLWFFLDRNHEDSNQDIFNKARQNLRDPQSWQHLAKLGGFICNGAIFRYARATN